MDFCSGDASFKDKGGFSLPFKSSCDSVTLRSKILMLYFHVCQFDWPSRNPMCSLLTPFLFWVWFSKLIDLLVARIYFEKYFSNIFYWQTLSITYQQENTDIQYCQLLVQKMSITRCFYIFYTYFVHYALQLQII